MKIKRGGHFLEWMFPAILVGVSPFLCVPANAAHEPIYAVDQYNNLIKFYSDAPGTIITAHAISGIQLGEEIRGIDYYRGTMYGLGSFSRLYSIDLNTAAATPVGAAFSPLLNGTTFGFDNGPAGLQVVSALAQNLFIDRTTGLVTVGPTLFYVAGDPHFGATPRVDALTYDEASGKWYAGDTLQNSLALFNPTTGGLTTIGLNGIDTSKFNGLDFSWASGIMYLGSAAASSDPHANLYTVDPTTGAVSLVGQIDYPGADTLIRALTVIPEPSSVTLLALGAFGLLFARRPR